MFTSRQTTHNIISSLPCYWHQRPCSASRWLLQWLKTGSPRICWNLILIKLMSSALEPANNLTESLSTPLASDRPGSSVPARSRTSVSNLMSISLSRQVLICFAKFEPCMISWCNSLISDPHFHEQILVLLQHFISVDQCNRFKMLQSVWSWTRRSGPLWYPLSPSISCWSLHTAPCHQQVLCLAVKRLQPTSRSVSSVESDLSFQDPGSRTDSRPISAILLSRYLFLCDLWRTTFMRAHLWL